jgi:hypothetical protein
MIFLFLLGSFLDDAINICVLAIHRNSLKESWTNKRNSDADGSERGVVQATPNQVYHRCNTETSEASWICIVSRNCHSNMSYERGN